MQMFVSTPSDDGWPDERTEQPYLMIEGSAGSYLRAGISGLTVGGRGGPIDIDDHVWPYERLREIRIDAYGPIGVIRATLRSSGADLPLILLEPHQIGAARRGLEVVWNLMASGIALRRTA
jgi:hypothetical protein